PAPRTQRDEAPPEPGDGARVRPEVPPEPPAVDVVAAIAEEAAQRPGRAVAREPARQHEHRVAVAAWCAREQRERGHEGRELEPGTPLDEIGEHTSELQSPCNVVCRLLLEKK